MANVDFYDELDLRYPEIAICIDKIDRTNPGTKNFYIPVLTPNVDTSSLKKKEEIIHQNNAVIDNKQSVDISSIKIKNYIPIKIPKELCAFVGGDFTVSNIGVMTFNSSGKITISGATSATDGTPHVHNTLSGIGTATYNGSEDNYNGILKTVPTDNYRYIDAGSKWIVVFIGGDINKPQIIGRYYDPE